MGPHEVDGVFLLREALTPGQDPQTGGPRSSSVTRNRGTFETEKSQRTKNTLRIA